MSEELHVKYLLKITKITFTNSRFCVACVFDIRTFTLQSALFCSCLLFCLSPLVVFLVD